ncbi:hypothetical protein O181_018615 [Austropuccinia psidii MF-1]|uniref:succinate-semialdehyde dehydrogenase [NAD(P)(+)] n=1 Tax=Austropuccinia psidii MF-1 TaxID=1389203 RepID=A0A9Q3GU79_9BASI|nr:hypothetical protein [Austropuccinia psidii MF-1]
MLVKPRLLNLSGPTFGRCFVKDKSIFYPQNISIAKPYSASAAPVLENLGLFKQKAYVNQKWVDSITSKTFPVNNPATGEEIGRCPDMDLDDLKLTIEAAKHGFSTYKSITPAQRRAHLREFDRLIRLNADDLAQIIVAENGKSWKDAQAEVLYAASFVDWFADEAIRTYGTIVPSSVAGHRHIVLKQPIGVVAALCPWNYPAAMVTRKVSPALAAGCPVIIKAPPETPLTSLALAELAHQAGFPPGVFNVITTQSTVEIGKALCECADIRKLSFTGSTSVGKLLMQQSSSSLKKLSLELGGNAPCIVFNDAEVDQAIEAIITAKFRGGGQTCISPNRIFVQSSIYAEFASKFARKVSQLKFGPGLAENVQIGPLINEKGLQKVSRHVNTAKDAGAEILVGGKKVSGPGYFFEPTVLSEVPVGVIDNEETFGPVAALYRFDSEAEVLEKANDSELGLAGYLFSKDLGRIWRVAEALEVGMVGVNTGMISNAMTPFGGVKQSGFGREGSWLGIEEYQVVKYMAMGGI